ncbi:MAG TPA: AraC family transcriptional regulator [Baekduia sp.]|uniref:AraC family transcriptional regulator n=1 Tax=Baekduia sp. TaxID=2600305 RepID=UPI002D768F00|nr:AraC family transcriptional regulator [Baekduia sp.]HET6510446.1 AraC family transcriptional regulator [Baekduia sp.]
MDVVYRELPPPPGLEALVACAWVSHDGPVRVLPDACVDVVFSGGRLRVAGPATTAEEARATPGQHRVGVRFRVGAAGTALGLPAGELRDLGVGLDELWGRATARAIEDRVARAATPADALLALIGGLAPRLPAPERADHEVRRAVLALNRPGSAPDVGALARAVALSERQLRRRFEAAVGYGPATLARILRFQRFLRLANAPMPAAAPTSAPTAAPSLARLAADAGYADQAHLAREVRRLAGLPPSALLAAGAGPAGEPAA